MAKKIADKKNIAMNFATKLYSKFKGFVRTIILVGSLTTRKEKKVSDIDLIVIVDNVTAKLTGDFMNFYRAELAKMINDSKHKDKLHITTLTLTSVWENLRIGEPAMISFLRTGVPLIDELNFFEPMKFLLRWGKIRPTGEAVFNAMTRAPYHLNKAKLKLFAIVEDLYWAMVDSSHALLMKHKLVPPSPEHIPKMLRKLLKKRQVTENEIKLYRKVRALMKKIAHLEIHDINEKDLGVMRDKVTKFVKKVEKKVKR